MKRIGNLLSTFLPFIIVGIMFGMGGCGNRDLFDTNYTYDRAIITLPDDKVIEVEIDQWKDYDGEQIQIISKDGTVYLTSSYNCTLIRDKK